MTKAQKILLLAAGLLIAALLIYPPWIEKYFAPEGPIGMKHRGYHLVWNKPAESEEKTRGVRIHSSKVFGFVLPIGIVTFIVYAWLGSQNRREGGAAPPG